jgi:hypothetical protein
MEVSIKYGFIISSGKIKAVVEKLKTKGPPRSFYCLE